jgi:hypothetical protein
VATNPIKIRAGWVGRTAIAAALVTLADNGRHLWTVTVGKHQHDTGPLPRKPVNIFPGDFGGVETPMAFAANRLFIPLPCQAAARRSAPSNVSKSYESSCRTPLT